MKLGLLLLVIMFVSCSTAENINDSSSKIEVIKGTVTAKSSRGDIIYDTIKVQNKFLDIYITDPIHGNSNFMYCIKDNAEITIDILDQFKKLLYSLDTEKNAGEHLCYLNTFDLSAKKVPEGEYFIKVEARSKGETFRELIPVTVIE